MNDEIDEEPKPIRKVKASGKPVILTWNKKTIANFKPLPRTRDVRTSQVRSLTAMLGHGEHWESTIAVNLNTSRQVYTIIDGHHRFLSFKERLALNPDFEMQVPAMQYLDLTEDEMVKIYRKSSARAVKQNINDRLKMERSTLPIVDKILKDFPLPVFASTHSVEGWNLQRLLLTYFNRKCEPKKTTRGDQESFMAAARMLNELDYRDLSDFCLVHQELYGKAGHDNPMCKTASLYILMKIWFFNLAMKVDRELLIKRMRMLAGESMFTTNGGSMDRIIMKQLYTWAIEHMNRRDKNKTIRAIPEGGIGDGTGI